MADFEVGVSGNDVQVTEEYEARAASKDSQMAALTTQINLLHGQEGGRGEQRATLISYAAVIITALGVLFTIFHSGGNAGSGQQQADAATALRDVLAQNAALIAKLKAAP